MVFGQLIGRVLHFDPQSLRGLGYASEIADSTYFLELGKCIGRCNRTDAGRQSLEAMCCTMKQRSVARLDRVLYALPHARGVIEKTIDEILVQINISAEAVNRCVNVAAWPQPCGTLQLGNGIR
jgi:hypothetical protein